MSDVPSFLEFNPKHIPWQYRLVYDIKKKIDFSIGAHEFLLTGTVGSAKSIAMTHLIVDHITTYDKSRACIGRVTKPDLKDTLGLSIEDHIEGDFEEGIDYELNRTSYTFHWANGSEIISRSWHKRKFQFGSLKLSFVGIEELAENTEEFWPAYEALYQRLGRLPHVPVNIMMSATNPDSPEHPAYIRFFESDSIRRHVYFSDTRDNPFLPSWYVPNLLEDLSPIEVERKIKGRWVSDPKGVIYYNYKSEVNYRNDEYVFDLNYPIDLMHDFNIGKGKPMSVAVGQHIRGVFHIARSYIVEGADTNDIMHEMANDDVFERKTTFRIYGDAAGKHADTRSKRDDYSIITSFLDRHRRTDNSKITYSLHVPLANPPIRKRHNKVNAKCCNGNGEIQLYVYKGAKDVDRGFKVVKLKKGAGYIEDDTIREQHVLTGIGYWITRRMKESAIQKYTFTQAR